MSQEMSTAQMETLIGTSFVDKGLATQGPKDSSFNIERDKYLLAFVLSTKTNLDINETLSQFAQEQTAFHDNLLAMLKAMGSMQDIGSIIKYLNQMLQTYQGNPQGNASIIHWIQSQLSLAKDGGLNNAGLYFYYQFVHHYAALANDLKRIDTDIFWETCCSYDDNGNFPDNWASIRQQLIDGGHADAINEFKEIYDMRNLIFVKNYGATGPDWGDIDGSYRIVIKDQDKFFQMYCQYMKGRFGPSLSEADLKSSFALSQNPGLREYYWKQIVSFRCAVDNTGTLGGLEGQFNSQLTIQTQKLTTVLEQMTTHTNGLVQGYHALLAGLSSSEQHLSRVIQAIVLDPENQ